MQDALSSTSLQPKLLIQFSSAERLTPKFPNSVFACAIVVSTFA
jgi:hypothetical protein